MVVWPLISDVLAGMKESSGRRADSSDTRARGIFFFAIAIVNNENVMVRPSCDVEFSNTWYEMYVVIIKILVIRMSKLEINKSMITKMATTPKSHFCNSMTVRSLQTAVDLQVLYGPIMNA